MCLCYLKQTCWTLFANPERPKLSLIYLSVVLFNGWQNITSYPQTNYSIYSKIWTGEKCCDCSLHVLRVQLQFARQIIAIYLGRKCIPSSPLVSSLLFTVHSQPHFPRTAFEWNYTTLNGHHLSDPFELKWFSRVIGDNPSTKRINFIGSYSVITFLETIREANGDGGGTKPQ